MIPRYQRVIFWTLAAASLLMAMLLLRGCVANHEHVIAMRDQSPIPAPVDSPDETVTIATANDDDGTLTMDQITLPLAEEPSIRARMLLERILADDAQSGSTHPLPGGAAVADVFFLALPLTNPASDQPSSAPQTQADRIAAFGRQSALSPYGQNHMPGAVLAVVDLTKTFAEAHPSSIESEDLTLRSIIATLHANFPQVEEVRFLVDGQSRETLAGHAVLERPYPVGEPEKQIHPLSADGSPE